MVVVFYHYNEIVSHPELVYKFEDNLRELCKNKVQVEESTDIVADYAFPYQEDVILVEVKTYSDFLNALVEKRIFEQIHKMRENSSLPPILLIYNVNAYKWFVKKTYGRGWREKWRVLQNQLNGFMAAYYPSPLKIYILETEDDIAYFLAALAHHLYVKKHDKIVPVSVSAKDPDEPLIAALSCIPGVSRKTAVALLEKFGTIEAIAQANIEQIVAVRTEGGRRIPVKVARNIKEFFRRRYGDRLLPPWVEVRGEGDEEGD